MVFWKKRKKGKIDNDIALKIVTNQGTQLVTFKELCLSNNLSNKAIASLLIKKGIITSEELLEEINRLKDEFRFREEHE